MNSLGPIAARRFRFSARHLTWLLAFALPTLFADLAAAGTIIPPPVIVPPVVAPPVMSPPVVVQVATTQPVSRVEPIVVLQIDPSQGSLQQLGEARINQLITTRVLGSLLLGANQQVNCGDCFSAFGVAGSASGGVSGRYNVTDSLAILAGASGSTFKERGADVQFAPTFAASLRYDPSGMGPSRPFFELGALASPGARVRYSRPDANAGAVAAGVGNTTTSTVVSFVRLGWVARLSQRDEVAAYVDYSHGWQDVGRYTERIRGPTVFNPATLGGTDEINVARVGAQYTTLLTDVIELNLNGAVAYAFDQTSGVDAAALAAGPAGVRLRDTVFFEGGGRIGFRVGERSVIDLFAIAAAGPQPIGTSLHGGVGWRYTF